MRKRYQQRKLNHARVETYKITHNPRYNNFLIAPDLIKEDVLKFVYEKDGQIVEKFIPMTFIGPHLQKKMFFYNDEFTLRREFRGTAYSVNAEIIYNY